MTDEYFSNRRKVNYATHVKFIVPGTRLHVHMIWAVEFNVGLLYGYYLRQYVLDNRRRYGIIYLTIQPSYTGDQYHGQLWRRKTEGPWANEHTQSSFRGCEGRVVLGQRVLRSPGPDPSQVRDASAGTSGQYVSFTGGQAVWVFQGVLLSNPASVRSEWVGRPYAATTRAQARSQADGEHPYFCYRLPQQSSLSACTWVGREDQRTVWRERTPSQYRTSPDTPAQKRAVNVSGSSAWFERCVGRYEILRQVVLSGRPYQRWGLALLIHRGLAAWMQAWSKIESSEQDLPVTQILLPDQNGLTMPDLIHGQIVMALAQMVLGALQEVAS